jgi:molybdate transport system regulatory protein
MAKLFLRVDIGADRLLGPGKVRLLEVIGELGSISAAGRAMGMSYRRAWLLVDEANRCFREPVVAARPGGRAGGGAALTRFGREVIGRYRAIEREAQAATAHHLEALEAASARPADADTGEANRPACCAAGRGRPAEAEAAEERPAARCRLPVDL